jgi:hypothetical protein
MAFPIGGREYVQMTISWEERIAGPVGIGIHKSLRNSYKQRIPGFAFFLHFAAGRSNSGAANDILQ